MSKFAARPLSLAEFRSVLLGEIEKELKPDALARSMYHQETHEMARCLVLAGASVEGIIADLTVTLSDYWPEVVLCGMAGLPLPAGWVETPDGYDRTDWIEERDAATKCYEPKP